MPAFAPSGPVPSPGPMGSSLPILWAHRGASAIAPENTMAAFRAACQAGADGLELDIRLSRDGTPVVIHDAILERTTSGSGPVARSSLAELRQLDAGAWFAPCFAGEPIPSLDEVLSAFSGRVWLNLEIKQAAAGAVVLELLRDHPTAEVVVSSFSWPLLRRLRRYDPDIRLAVLLDRPGWHRALAVARDISACALHVAADHLSWPLAAACRRQGLPVFPFTVDSLPRARRLGRVGAAGFFTNDPAALTHCRTWPVLS